LDKIPCPKCSSLCGFINTTDRFLNTKGEIVEIVECLECEAKFANFYKFDRRIDLTGVLE